MEPARRQRLRTALGHKGMEINGKLTRILANQNVTLAKWPSEREPGLRPEERLRRFLDQIARAQQRLGTAGWGRCLACGDDLPEAALDDTPWIERCAGCAATG